MKITDAYADITEWFFTHLSLMLDVEDTVMVGLGGGTSFDAWYPELLQDSSWQELETDKIRWCVTDERVNCKKKDRNDEHIWEVFLSQLCAGGFSREEYFLRPQMDSDGVEYSQRVGAIDIAFFGMGADGHTASLFPGHEALQSEELGFIKIENAPKNPPERISLSPQSIQNIPHRCLFAVGEGKREALIRFFDITLDAYECPIKLIHPAIILDDTGGVPFPNPL